MVSKKIQLILLFLIILIGIFFFFKEETAIDNQKTLSTNKIETKEKLISLYKSKKQNLPSHDIVCIPEKKSYCSHDGCGDVEPTVFILVGGNPTTKEVSMSRCDDKPCDTYPVNFIGNGSFYSLETKEPHGLTFKGSNIDNSYTEAVTLGTDSFVSNGFCYGAENI